MTDKTDPRLNVAKGWAAEDWEQELRNEGITFADDSLTERAQDMLADLDAADRAAGIVRVDTNDEALVERLAQAEREARASYWDATTPAERAATGVDGVSRHVARAVLAALREAS